MPARTKPVEITMPARTTAIEITSSHGTPSVVDATIVAADPQELRDLACALRLLGPADIQMSAFPGECPTLRVATADPTLAKTLADMFDDQRQKSGRLAS